MYLTGLDLYIIEFLFMKCLTHSYTISSWLWENLLPEIHWYEKTRVLLKGKKETCFSACSVKVTELIVQKWEIQRSEELHFGGWFEKLSF